MIIRPRAKAIDGGQQDSTEVELASGRPETGPVASTEYYRPSSPNQPNSGVGSEVGTSAHGKRSTYRVGSINSWPVPRTPAPSTHRFEFEDVTSPISGPGESREMINVGTRDRFGHSWGTWAAPWPLVHSKSLVSHMSLPSTRH